jgi:hypothetical protein
MSPALPVRPATEWIFVISIASSNSSGGRIVGRRFASIVLPDPGGPYEKNVMAAGTRDLESAFGRLLSADLVEVDRRSDRLASEGPEVEL